MESPLLNRKVKALNLNLKFKRKPDLSVKKPVNNMIIREVAVIPAASTQIAPPKFSILDAVCLNPSMGYELRNVSRKVTQRQSLIGKNMKIIQRPLV